MIGEITTISGVDILNVGIVEDEVFTSKFLTIDVDGHFAIDFS